MRASGIDALVPQFDHSERGKEVETTFGFVQYVHVIYKKSQLLTKVDLYYQKKTSELPLIFAQPLHRVLPPIQVHLPETLLTPIPPPCIPSQIKDLTHCIAIRLKSLTACISTAAGVEVQRIDQARREEDWTREEAKGAVKNLVQGGISPRSTSLLQTFGVFSFVMRERNVLRERRPRNASRRMLEEKTAVALARTMEEPEVMRPSKSAKSEFL